MKKLALAAVLAASFSAPVMAGDIMALPWPFRTTGAKVTSVTPAGPMQTIKLAIVGSLFYDNPDYMIPNGVVVNPAITVKSDTPTLNGAKVPKTGLQNFVGATCAIVGSSPNFFNSGGISPTAQQYINATHTATTVTCTK